MNEQGGTGFWAFDVWFGALAGNLFADRASGERFQGFDYDTQRRTDASQHFMLLFTCLRRTHSTLMLLVLGSIGNF